MSRRPNLPGDASRDAHDATSRIDRAERRLATLGSRVGGIVLSPSATAKVWRVTGAPLINGSWSGLVSDLIIDTDGASGALLWAEIFVQFPSASTNVDREMWAHFSTEVDLTWGGNAYAKEPRRGGGLISEMDLWTTVGPTYAVNGESVDVDALLSDPDEADDWESPAPFVTFTQINLDVAVT